MRKLMFTTGMFLSIALFFYIYHGSESARLESSKTEIRTIRPPESGPDVQRWFFETWHEHVGGIKSIRRIFLLKKSLKIGSV